LCNRSPLLDRFDRATPQAARERKTGRRLALDMDRFKGVSDELGNAAGDSLRPQVVARLCGSIRGCHAAWRYAGDKLVMRTSEIDGPADADAAAMLC
jgi:diguanylate cyclase (GGDEF)-like protein